MALTKENKKNLRVVLVIAIFLFLINANSSEQATYETCTSLHGGDLLMTFSDYDACRSYPGCYPVMSTGINFFGGTGNLAECLQQWLGVGHLNGVMLDCTSAGEINNYVVADSANQGCQSGSSVKVGSFCSQDVYKCVQGEPETQCTEGSWQKSIVDSIKSVWPTAPGDCNTLAFGSIGVAVLIFFALL